MKLSELKLNPNNPRFIRDEKFKKLVHSIKQDDKFTAEMMKLRPIVIDDNNMILAGNMRYRAFLEIGKTEIPDEWIKQASDMTEEQRQRFIVEDNLAFGETDFDVLANNFEVSDLLEWGFDEKELKIDLPVEEDDVPEVQEEAVSKLGEIYQLGNHRLMCGDSTKIEDVEKLMDGQKADMVFTDPPYNVDYSNADRPKPSKRDLGVIQNDKMEVSIFKDFISDILNNTLIVTKSDCSLYLWYASASASAILNSFDESGWKRTQEIIWKKPMLLGRSRYQWAHEPCIFAVKGQPFFIADRTKTTVWDIGGYDKSKNNHPTQKPVAICSEGIQNSSKQEDIVLDLFGGSGSTLIACEQLNRKCFMMELDPKYIDVIIKRWENLTGDKAVKL